MLDKLSTGIATASFKVCALTSLPGVVIGVFISLSAKILSASVNFLLKIALHLVLPLVIPLAVRIHFVPFHSMLPVPLVHSTLVSYASDAGNEVLISPSIVIAKVVSGAFHFAS